MKIKFLRDCKYPQNNQDNSREYKAGEVYEVPDDHAQRWIRRNAAVEVPAEKPVKRAERMIPEATKAEKV